jgi:AraC-like DNA-binding protein
LPDCISLSFQMSEDTTTSQSIDRVLSGSIHRQAVEEVGAPLKRYYSLDIHQLRPGNYPSRLDFVASSGAIIYRENYPRATRIVGELLGGRFGLGIRLGATGGTFAGEEVAGRNIPSAMSGEQIDFTGESGYRQMIMVVDQAKLLQMAEAARVAPRILQGLRPGRQGMNLSAKPHAAACVAKTFGKMLDHAVAGEIEARQENFEDLVYEAILSLVEHSDLSYGRPPAAAIVRRATELVESSPGMVPRIHVLAARLHMSPRTLQKAFVSVTGLGPQAYFRHCALNRARHALLRANPVEDKVTAIAVGLGFSEIGRFSVRYRELFGESPSQTLQRSPRCMVAIPG